MNQTPLELARRERVYSSSLLTAIVVIWLLVFATFSPPDDWRTERWGTVPILPPALLSVIKLLGRASAASLLIICLWNQWNCERRPHVLLLVIPLLIYASLAMMSTSWSALKTITLFQAGTFCILVALSIYVAMVWRGDMDTDRLFKHLVIVIFSLSLVLLSLHFGMPRSGSLTKNASGIMHSTNAGAAGGLCILLVMMSRLLWSSRWSRWWLPIVSIETAMMLIASNRLSILITLVTVVLLFVLVVSWEARAISLLLLCSAVVAYFVLDAGLVIAEETLTEIGMYAKQGQSSAELGSLSGRAEMWDKMWESISQSPILGHGFAVTTAKGRMYVWGDYGNWTAHNVILQVLATMGCVGLALFAIQFLVLAFGLTACLHSRSETRRSAIALIFAGAWFCSWGTLNESFAGPLTPESVVFAVLLGIAVSICAQRRLQSQPRYAGAMEIATHA